MARAARWYVTGLLLVVCLAAQQAGAQPRSPAPRPTTGRLPPLADALVFMSVVNNVAKSFSDKNTAFRAGEQPALIEQVPTVLGGQGSMEGPVYKATQDFASMLGVKDVMDRLITNFRAYRQSLDGGSDTTSLDNVCNTWKGVRLVQKTYNTMQTANPVATYVVAGAALGPWVTMTNALPAPAISYLDSQCESYGTEEYTSVSGFLEGVMGNNSYAQTASQYLKPFDNYVQQQGEMQKQYGPMGPLMGYIQQIAGGAGGAGAAGGAGNAGWINMLTGGGGAGNAGGTGALAQLAALAGYGGNTAAGGGATGTTGSAATAANYPVVTAITEAARQAVARQAATRQSASKDQAQSAGDKAVSPQPGTLAEAAVNTLATALNPATAIDTLSNFNNAVKSMANLSNTELAGQFLKAATAPLNLRNNTVLRGWQQMLSAAGLTPPAATTGTKPAAVETTTGTTANTAVGQLANVLSSTRQGFDQALRNIAGTAAAAEDSSEGTATIQVVP